MRRTRSRSKAFTLIELMIVVALIAIIVTLAAPSFRDMILMQRLRGINAQLVTDLAFARSEAVSRGTFMQVHFQSNGTMTCYIILASTTPATSTPICDCTVAAGSRCSNPTATEVKTVQAPVSESVRFDHNVSPTGIPTSRLPYFTIDPRTGGVWVASIPENVNAPTFVVETSILIDPAPVRRFRNLYRLSGQLSVCTPSGSTVGGPAC